MSEPSDTARNAGIRELRSRLAAAGYRPSRRLGQNLLVDENTARGIARDAQLAAGDRVLEVGPGAGALTQPLAELGVSLLAVEIDARLLQVVRERVADLGVEFVHADVLAKKGRLAPEVDRELPDGGAWHLVSNLPYSISGPLLVVLSRRSCRPRSMTVLVQREVAERLVAEPGSAAWGALSARLQVLYTARRTRDVPGHLFWPQPKVESSVVRLEERGDAPGAEQLQRFDKLLEQVFGRRRQTLLRVLGDALGDRDAARSRLESAGIDPGRRAETLSIEELGRLAQG